MYNETVSRMFAERTVVCINTFERKRTVGVCVASIIKHSLGARVWIDDDASRTYDIEWLSSQFPSARIEGRISNQGASLIRMQQARRAYVLGVKGDAEFAYFADADTYADPNYMRRLGELGTSREKWGAISLYNSRHRASDGIEGPNVSKLRACWRSVAPGCSMLVRCADLGNISVPWSGKGGWDWHFAEQVAGRRVLQSVDSYVEHFGGGGIHSRDHNFDRAVNPTPYLQEIRPAVLSYLDPPRAGAHSL